MPPEMEDQEITSLAPDQSPPSQDSPASDGAGDPSPEPKTPAPAPEAAAPGANPQDPAAPPAYTPNFKVKVMDEEHEIDDWARQYIKDQESEKKFKELYEKALGLPYAKQRAEKSQQTVQEVTEKWNTQQKRLGKILGYIEKKDFGSFIREMKIPEDLVLQHALERIQYQELTPEQRAQYDARTAERQRLYELEEQASSSSEYAKQVATQARTLEVNTFLSRSDVQPAVQSFDNRVGKPGAFVEEVWNMGKYLALTTGMDLPVDQVVNEVIRRYGIAPNPAAMGQQGIPSANPGQKPQAKPPVIPNLSGSHSASPAKKMPGSLDDLKKLAAAANAD